MKSSERASARDYLEVMVAVYTDATIKCTADVSDLRDLETIRSRVEHEGLSFLTITLPRFANAIERCLAGGKIDSALFTGFEIVRGGSIPVFLQGMISQVFDRETGKVIAHEPPRLSFQKSSELATRDIPTVVEAIRQICRVFARVELECTPKRVQAALDSFCAIEQDLQTFSVPDLEHSKFLGVSSMLWDNMVWDFHLDRIVPKHGPGATAERVSGNGKYRWQRWHDRIEPYFPLLSNAFPLGTCEAAEELNNCTIIPEDDEQPVRVVVVPKTLKSPRVIAIEPCCMQYAQQAIRDYLYDSIESSRMTAGRINFRSQSINQRMAVKASRTGRYATIDLSEASDRVPLSLAMEMFSANPELRDSILACRSTRAELPDGRILDPLLKFASMGSALCFPIEAMYFYTVCVVALMEGMGLSYTFKNCRKAAKRVYIYGDDILVPTMYADVVLDHLRKYNCKVNADKTFVSGCFRESCGVDAYAGYPVTPVYIRKEPPKNKQQHAQIVSWCATLNLFYSKGYWRTTTLLLKRVERILGQLPYVHETSGLLGRHSFLGFESIGRWNEDLQRNEVFGWVPRPVYRSDELEGWSALVKCFLLMDRRSAMPVDDPLIGSERLLMGLVNPVHFQEVGEIDRNHLKRTALHGAVTLKRRWSPTH